jgi:hypothetical protein
MAGWHVLGFKPINTARKSFLISVNIYTIDSEFTLNATLIITLPIENVIPNLFCACVTRSVVPKSGRAQTHHRRPLRLHHRCHHRAQRDHRSFSFRMFARSEQEEGSHPPAPPSLCVSDPFTDECKHKIVHSRTSSIRIRDGPEIPLNHC